MEITEEWIASIQDDQGLTNGQQALLEIWKKRLAYVGYNHLPDQVAKFLEGCNGYRGLTPYMLERLSNENFKRHMVGTLS